MIAKVLKNSIEGMKDVKSVLIVAGIEDLITGEIRLFQRKLGSTKEDCVINTLIWDAEQIQGGVLNINFHVPNLPGSSAENPTVVDNTQPDIERMEYLGRIASSKLDGYIGPNFSLKLRDPGHIENFGTQWLYNIQVEYTFLRTDI